MKQRKLSKIITTTICLEMILAPLPAFAEKTLVESITGTVLDVTKVGAGAYNTYMETKNAANGANPYTNQAAAQNMQAFKDQQTPQKDKIFNQDLLTKVPGLAQYLALSGIDPNSINCATLPTSLTEISAAACTAGISSPQDGQQAQAYAEAYGQIENV